jgi:pyrroloquinoline quinone (PQQ) biosynthesis protein C
MMSARRFLAELRREIERHPAVNHLFLQRIATAPFSREDYRVFGENHFPLVCVFTSYLERLLLRAPGSESKMWLAKVLVDEYGEGSRGEDHATLYAHFLRATGSCLPDEPERRVPAAAAEFIRRHQELVAKEPFLVGLGAVGPGHEWAIPQMFASVIRGLERARFAPEEIQYFTLHVEQDQDHGTWLEEALARFSESEEQKALIRRGALASLDARGRFWTGVQQAIVRFRQPRSARLDGPVPRGIAREILLTAWDGWKTGQVLERSVLGWRERRLPTIRQLLEEARGA